MRVIRRPSVVAVTAVTAVALMLGGCASAAPDTNAAPAPAGPSGPNTLEGELTIYAAASLKGAFDEIATEFESQHRGVDVLPIVYDGSSTLVTQLSEGAVADVFASADEANMHKTVTADILAGEPVPFATNTLVIAMPAGNPGDVVDLESLTDPALSVVLCAPEVPCGAASLRLLDAAGLTVTAKSLEQNVTAVLTKVAEDIADAGLVYATDVAGRDDVEHIVPEGAENVVNRYPIAQLADAPNPAAAAAFIAFVTGPEGQAVLTKHGFGPP